MITGPLYRVGKLVGQAIVFRRLSFIGKPVRPQKAMARPTEAR
jgi:hypothetical protein